MVHTLVIGGTRGLGREIVKLFDSENHHVSVVGRREPIKEDLDIPNARYYLADFADQVQLKNTLESIVQEQGKLNYLVFCQRYRGEGDTWQGELDVSLTATKTAIEALQDKFAAEGDKSIVIVSSVFGDFVGEGQPLSYHVGKAGLNQLMRFYAVNLGRKGIRVNAVTPFTFLKEESKAFYLKNQALYDLYCQMTPLGRMATSEDSAKAVAFLCSPMAGFINGHNLYVDGGLSLVWPETLARKLTAL